MSGKSSSASAQTGRFAPTPSGDMHLGNLLCALIAYLSIKSKGGKFAIRIEDLDTVRCPRESGERILDTLARFGLISELPVLWQSERSDVYACDMRVLDGLGLTYPCFCTRAQLHAAEAPRLADGGVVYAGTCRHMTESERSAAAKRRSPCIRVAVPDITIEFDDVIKGRYTQSLSSECGDFIIRRSDGVFAYQLAVVTDDGRCGVTEVVRGDDLISSTPRQLWLMKMLGYAPPEYMHIPLVYDSKGRKLSKSEGDKISEQLKRLPPERILGGLAYAAGILNTDRAAELDELVTLYSPQKLSRSPILLPPSLDL